MTPTRGYIEKTAIENGHTYRERTYVADGSVYVRFYRPFYYHGVILSSYVPAAYYQPDYYMWLGQPWGAGISFGWSWTSEPWYMASGGYFSPDAAYPAPAFWITDYVLAQNLSEGYDIRTNAGVSGTASSAGTMQFANGGGPNTPITPGVKQAIVGEVQNQIETEQAQAVADPNQDAGTLLTPAALDPKLNTFIVSRDFDVNTVAGQECTLSEGDILRLPVPLTNGATEGILTVVASESGDCVGNSAVTVNIEDLQEMSNHFAERVDAGLQVLAQQQGKNAIPAAAGITSRPGVVATGETTPNSTELQSQMSSDRVQAQQAITAQQNFGLDDQTAPPTGANP